MKPISLPILLIVLLTLTFPVCADEGPAEILKAITKIRAIVPDNSRTAKSLGTEREGNGVVIDSDGYVLTIGYLILEAEKIEIFGPNGKTVNATFTAYGTTVRGSATATVMSNATRTCLSCHDGTQAMNGMANAPGSGNAQIDANGLGPITGAAVIDGNFSDDHPLGVIYDTANDLRTPAAASPITGLVKMNAVSSVLATSGADTVECASCHDVHNDSGTPLFLPFANTGSQLCLTCHLK